MVGKKIYIYIYSQISHCNKKKTAVSNPPSMREIKRSLQVTLFVLFTSNDIILWDRCVVVCSKQSHCYVLLLWWNEARTQFHTNRPSAHSLCHCWSFVPSRRKLAVRPAQSSPSPSRPPPNPFCSYTLLKPPSSNPSGSQHTTTTHTHTLTHPPSHLATAKPTPHTWYTAKTHTTTPAWWSPIPCSLP